MENIHFPRLLTFNCHEAWVHRLENIGAIIDILDGLPGRYCHQWDLGVRPLPRNSTLLTLEQVLAARPSYDCIIAHNITDLLDCKSLPGPRILIIHSTLHGRMRQHGLGMPPEQLKALVRLYLDWVGGHAVAISPLKGKSWGFTEDIVASGVDVGQYNPWGGEVAAGLRISNQIQNRKEILLWEFHQASFQGVPLRLVGFNPDMPGVFPSQSWDDLKSILSSHRFYVHTAHPDLEDGYNMATLEAMGAGLPVLGNRHPTSPVEHGVSGFLSDDPRELGQYAKLLLHDQDLAGRMGQAARRKAAASFPMEGFVRKFQESILKAREKWPRRKAPDFYFSPAEKDPDPKVRLEARNGELLPLGVAFRGYWQEGEIEKAVSILDEMMQKLGLARDIEIHDLRELIQIVLGVIEQIKKIQDDQSATVLLQTMLESFSSGDSLAPNSVPA
ncbi:MAG: glycosyltransferase [Deltaproteobacteria bacterium]|nr:glycosyltransferase [Deltaproteobacteria bacterium]